MHELRGLRDEVSRPAVWTQVIDQLATANAFRQRDVALIAQQCETTGELRLVIDIMICAGCRDFQSVAQCLYSRRWHYLSPERL